MCTQKIAGSDNKILTTQHTVSNLRKWQQNCDVTQRPKTTEKQDAGFLIWKARTATRNFWELTNHYPIRARWDSSCSSTLHYSYSKGWFITGRVVGTIVEPEFSAVPMRMTAHHKVPESLPAVLWLAPLSIHHEPSWTTKLSYDWRTRTRLRVESALRCKSTCITSHM